MAIETVEQFYKRIIDRVVVDVDELPKAMTAAWFVNPDTKSPTMFEVQKLVPFDPYSRVIAIFQSEETIRIFSLAAAPPVPPDPNWQARQPTRYTLSRLAPTYVAEILTLEGAADAIADEWNELAGPDTAEDELGAVVEFVAGLEPLIKRDELLAQLNDGAHHDEEDEEEPAPVVPMGPPKLVPPPPVAGPS